MTKKLFFLLGLLMALQANAQNIRYVTTTGSGTMDGTSWSNASNDIQLMMDALTSGGEVWIAAGTYIPTRDRLTGVYTPGGQSNSFVMRNDVKLYGGFSGSEAYLAERNLFSTANTTILSGDLLQDDIMAAFPPGYEHYNQSENINSIITATGDLGSIEINGITIKGGDGAKGAGLYLVDTVLNLKYTTVADNAAYDGGGGLYVKNSAVIAANCVFTNNIPGEGFGGGILFDFYNGTISQNSTFNNCVFSYNRNMLGNGGLLAYMGQGPAPVFNNCTLYSNGSEFPSPAVYYENDQNLVFNNCVIGKPVLLLGESYPFCETSNITFRHVLTDYSGVALSPDSYNNLFNTNPFFVDVANGNFRIVNSSLAINYGSNALVPAGVTTDIMGSARILGGNVDLGAYESSVTVIAPDENGIVYVTENGSGDMTGSSWSNATPDFARALVIAYGNSSITKIFIGGGTYKPAYKPDDFSGANPYDRNNSFRLVQNVKIYGGFAGNETSFGERAFLPENETILTGDLNGDDSPGFGYRGDNSYHVLILPYDTNGVLIDGVTITGGNANLNEDIYNAPVISGNTYLRNQGGGLCARSYCNLKNVRFIENFSIGQGGAIDIQFGAGISNSQFLGNLTEGNGGAIYDAFPGTTIENSKFENNISYGSGGVLYGYQNTVFAYNSLFTHNNSHNNTGLIYEAYQGDAVFENCTIADNGSAQNSHTLFSGISAQFQNCIIAAPQNAATGTRISDNLNSFLFENTLATYPGIGVNAANTGNILTGNAYFTDAPNGDYTLLPMSPAVNNGSNIFVSMAKDIAGNDRLLFGTVDMGAYESTVLGPGPDGNGILYVKKGGNGSQLGNSWANALPEVADALYLAKFYPAIQQIWVAGGTYKPQYDPVTHNKNEGARRNTFVMVPDVKIYGGFAGTETALAQRDLALEENKSVLSGDMNGDDNPVNFANNSENAYHVVVAAGEVGTAELNGFTVMGGKAEYLFDLFSYPVNEQVIYPYSGAGLYIKKASPVIANVTVLNNSAYYPAGGAYIENANPVFNYTSFINNNSTSGDWGGGVFIQTWEEGITGRTAFNNCFFYKNLAYNGNIGNELQYYSNVAEGGAPAFNNCTVIAGDAMPGYPAVPFYFTSEYNIKTPEFNNCIMMRPTGDWSSAFSENYNCDVLIRHCFTNYGVINYNPGNTGNVYAADPFFTNPENGDYTLRPYSLALNIGNNAFAAGLETDLAGNPRIQHGTVDPGAFETAKQAIPKPDANGIVYVNKNASGTGEGDSWENARQELSDALLAAQFNPAVQEIWVAGGKYTPQYHPLTFDYDPANRENAFVLKAGVKLYGGFAGNEASLGERDLTLDENASILSGDFNGNDPNYSDDYGYDFTTQQENAHHVVIAAGAMGDATLDGFTVTGGHADADTPLALNGESIAGHYGGGLYMAGCPLPVERVTFLYNFAEAHGGGMYIDGENPYITACLFDYNVAPNGAGMYARQGSPAVTNTVFFQNRASVAGGGMYFDGGAPVLTNLTMMRNYAEDGNSGGIYNSFSATAIRNTIIVNNNGGVYDDGGASLVAYSFVQDMPGGENGNLDGSMYFGNMMFPGEYDGNFAAAYPMFAGMGSNDYFTASQTPDLSGIVTDFEGGQRLYGTVDMGAIESTMLPFPVADENGIVYIKQDGLGNGTSWDNAANNIQDAMFADGVQQIWVAGGTYTPTYTPDETLNGAITGTPRDRTFLIMPDIKIYGGFAGNEASFAERDLSIQANASILSGDLTGNDIAGDFESRMENSLHVVLSVGAVGDALLDGFTITGGSADGTGNLYVYSSWIREDSGGGMHIYDSSPVLSRIIFKDNYGGIGGGIFTQFSATFMTNCLFYDNISSYGGGICNWQSSPVITNATITKNQGHHGGGIYNFSSNPSLNNTILCGNTGFFDNGDTGVVNLNSYPLWSSCLIQDFNLDFGWDNNLGTNGSNNRGFYTMYNDPVFNNPDNNDYTPHPAGAALNSGNSSLYPDAATAFDLAGRPRLYGPIDMGAYESHVVLPCTATTAWDTTGWSNGVPSSEMYSVEIFTDYNSAEHGPITACSLLVHSGNVVIASGDNFTVKGSITINNENASLTVQHNANLIQADDVENDGEITVIKESAPMYRLDYAMWASPVAEQKLKAFSPQTLDNRFYTYNPLSDAYATVQAPSTTDFAEGKGYLIRVDNTHPAYVEGEDGTPWEGTFEGVPNNGTATIAVIAQSEGVKGFNAIGNPYPSSINIAAFFEANQSNLSNISPIYFWRKKNEAGTSSYASLTLAGYNANSGNDFGDSSNGVFADANDSENWVINPGQGFIVRAVANTVTFNNQMRRAVNNGQMFRSAQDATDKSRLWLNLTNAEGAFGQTTIAYTPTTTLGLDFGWDGQAMTDGEVAVYSLAGDVKLGIQARPAFDVADEVPLGYKITTAGTYSISLDHVDGVFAEGQAIYLRDNLLGGTTHNLSDSAYEFATETGSITGRFDVVYAEALGTPTSEFDASSIIVYTQGGAINISSGTVDMKAVQVYDIRGRLLYSSDNINASATSITTLEAQEQMLIVRVTTVEGVKANRKIVL